MNETLKQILINAGLFLVTIIFLVLLIAFIGSHLPGLEELRVVNSTEVLV